MSDYVAPGQEISDPLEIENMAQGEAAHLRKGDYVVDQTVNFKDNQALRARRHPDPGQAVSYTYGTVNRIAPKVDISGRGITSSVLNGGTKPGIELDGLAVKGTPLDDSNHGGQALHEFNGSLKRCKVYGAPGVGMSGMAGLVEGCWFLDNGSLNAATAGGNGASEAGQLKSVRKGLTFRDNLVEGGFRYGFWGDCNASEWELATSLFINIRNAPVAFEVMFGVHAHHFEIRDNRDREAMPRVWISGSKDIHVEHYKLVMPNYNSPVAAMVKNDPRPKHTRNTTSCKGSWPTDNVVFNSWPEPDTKDGFSRIVLQDGIRHGGKDSGAPVEIYDMPDAFKIVTGR